MSNCFHYTDKGGWNAIRAQSVWRFQARTSMIGGIDVQIPTRCGPSLSTEVAVRAIRQRWPHSDYENGLTGERYFEFNQIPFGEIQELFVYRDRPRPISGT